jgi:hypothetical protein
MAAPDVQPVSLAALKTPPPVKNYPRLVRDEPKTK